MPARNTTETSAEWRARIMDETRDLKWPGEILAHLAADMKKNGAPPKPTADELRAASKDGADV